jgi:hypothetical protein
MNPNNQVWWEVAQGRSQDARRWKQQEQLLKQARSDEPNLGRKAALSVGAVAANILNAARKVIAGLKSVPDNQRERVRGKPKSYA